jgi:DNA-binding NarL/FixJ family response regulator
MATRILIVDDHPIVHEVLGAMVKVAFPAVALSIAGTLEKGLERARSERIDLVLLDLGLPDCSGLEALKRFRAQLPDLKVVVFSAIEERHVVLAAIEAGAQGYIPKTHTPAVIVAALRVIAAGGVYLPLQILGERTPNAREVLTQRQLDVLRLIVRGFPNKEIAQHLRIAKDTVKQHARAVYAALGVASRGQAARAAQRRGIKLD